MEYMLLLDKESGNVRFWMERAEFLAFYDVVMQHWQPRQWKFEERVWLTPLPSDWPDAWQDYVVVDGELVRRPEAGANVVAIRRSIEQVAALIASYKNHIREYASKGLPTTAIGNLKLDALAVVARIYLADNLATGSDWDETAGKLWPSMTPKQAAHHVVAQQELRDKTTWELLKRGSLV